MTRDDFVKVVAYLTAGTGKALEESQLEVYFDCLGDLPVELFAVAAKAVLLARKFANFPTIAELREAATVVGSGTVCPLTPAEAWHLAWQLVAATDPEVPGCFERQVARFGVPPLVVEAVFAFGLDSLCYGREPVSVVRGQFMKIFEQLAGRQLREKVLDGPTRAAIENRTRVKAALAGIGSPENP